MQDLSLKPSNPNHAGRKFLDRISEHLEVTAAGFQGLEIEVQGYAEKRQDMNALFTHISAEL